MSLPQTVHLVLRPDLGGFCLFSYAPRQPVLQNSWKASLESTWATMVPFMFVMSFLHMVQLFLGAGLCEKAERQVVEQNRCVEPLRWYAVWPFFRGFLQLAQVTLTVLGCGWEPEEEEEEEDWPGGLGREVAGDGESTPVCFWLRGTEADWEIHESALLCVPVSPFCTS